MWWETKVRHWNMEVTGSGLGALGKPVQPEETTSVEQWGGLPQLSPSRGGGLS